MTQNSKRSSFSSQIGFVLSAAGSAVGLGNIWRFPYLAAKDGGGLFLFFYLVLVLTFGFTLLITEIAIGRKTRQSPLNAYKQINRRWGFIGIFACLIPAIILPYYCEIGGWVFKYLFVYITGSGTETASEGFFTSFIALQAEPVFWVALFLGITVFIVYNGVDKGIERFSKVLMPILFFLIVSIGLYSLTLSYTDGAGVTRTGLEGLGIYIIPNFSDLSAGEIFSVLMDAMGQLFFSISVAMGIMIAYGSYSKKETNLLKAVSQIEIFDTAVAFLAGMMIIPAVYTFFGTEGMSAGPGLLFVSMPHIFSDIGKGAGSVIGAVFFLMVSFAALTSSVSILEAVVSCVIDSAHMERKKATLTVGALAFIAAVFICLGYSIFYFEIPLPNGSTGQLLDLFDYVSNYCLMPLVALLTCILIGWIAGPDTVIEEAIYGGYRFTRKRLYTIMIRFVAPVLLAFLILQSVGLINL